jgi:hypothetical protein
MCGSGLNLTDVCPNGDLFSPVVLFKTSRAFLGSLYVPGAGRVFLMGVNL